MASDAGEHNIITILMVVKLTGPTNICKNNTEFLLSFENFEVLCKYKLKKSFASLKRSITCFISEKRTVSVTATQQFTAESHIVG